MRQISSANFGLLIAYVLPGLTPIIGISCHSSTVASWLGDPDKHTATIGGFLYVTLASISAGMLVSTIRWLTIDWLHHGTGLIEPVWDFSKLELKTTAFDTLVDIHYRYYQFHANTLVALWFSFFSWRLALGFSRPLIWPELVLALTTVVLFLGSRDTLTKYYRRVGEVLKEEVALDR